MLSSQKSVVHPGAHEAQERTQAPLQSNLIAMSSHAEEVKEWFYFPDSGPHGGEITGRDIPLYVRQTSLEHQPLRKSWQACHGRYKVVSSLPATPASQSCI